MTIEQLVTCMLCLIILHFSLVASVASIKSVKNTVSQFDDLSILESIVSYIDAECKCAQGVDYINNFYVGTPRNRYFVKKGILINYLDKNENSYFVIYYIGEDGIYREKVDGIINTLYLGSSETLCNNIKIKGIDIIKVENRIYIEGVVKKHIYRYLIST
jgi:hypothetical protein